MKASRVFSTSRATQWVIGVLAIATLALPAATYSIEPGATSEHPAPTRWPAGSHRHLRHRDPDPRRAAARVRRQAHAHRRGSGRDRRSRDADAGAPRPAQRPRPRGAARGWRRIGGRRRQRRRLRLLLDRSRGGRLQDRGQVAHLDHRRSSERALSALVRGGPAAKGASRAVHARQRQRWKRVLDRPGGRALRRSRVAAPPGALRAESQPIGAAGATGPLQQPQADRPDR